MRDILILNDEHKVKIEDYQLEDMIKVLFQNGYKYVVISHDRAQYEIQACNLKKENVGLDEVEDILQEKNNERSFKASVNQYRKQR